MLCRNHSCCEALVEPLLMKRSVKHESCDAVWKQRSCDALSKHMLKFPPHCTIEPLLVMLCQITLVAMHCQLTLLYHSVELDSNVIAVSVMNPTRHRQRKGEPA